MTDLTATPRITPAERIRLRVLTAHLLAKARSEPERNQKWQYLEAAHIAGQTEWASHLRTYRAMLMQALREGNLPEVAAQLLRLTVVPLGHLLNRLPVGNPGSARAPAFKPQPVPLELAGLIQAASKTVVTN